MFVGDPTDGGSCVPCLEYCHGHSAICVENSTDIDLNDYLDLDDYIAQNVREGPKANAKCLGCSNLTSGARCDECIVGEWQICYVLS